MTKRSGLPYSLTMTASHFRYWVTPVLRTAGKDPDWLPLLCSVQFAGTGTHVLAVSTDRFRASAHRHAAEDVPTFTLLLSRRSVQRVLDLWRPNKVRRYDPDLTLTFSADGLAVAGDGVSITLPVLEGDYPNVRDVFTRSLNADLVHTPAVALRPEYLDGFGWFKGHARIHVSAPNKAVIVQLGEDFLGLVMPVRVEEETDWADWSPTLQGASK